MKQILLFPLLLLFTVVSAASQIVIDGRPAVCDSATGMMLLSVPDSVFGQPYSAPVIAMQDVTGLMINGQQITDHVDLPLVDGTTSYPVEYLYNGKTVNSTLRFTYLPVMRLDGEFNGEYANGKVEMILPDAHEALQYDARIKWAGTYGVHKHNYHIKFVDSVGAKMDVSFFGLRNDNHWRLDAGTVDMVRIRNKAAHALWAKFGHKPYFADLQPKARNYVRGHHVEMFLNGEYLGFFDMAEFLDRKQMKLKKYDDELGEFHGMMWKGKDGTPQTLFNQSLPYDNNAENWGGFDVTYPDIDDVCPTDFSVISNAVDFVTGSNDQEFADHMGEYFDLPVMVDYYIFMQTLLAIDNTSKNIVWSCYDSQVDKMITPSVWDFDATVGQTWYDGPTHYHNAEIQPEIDMDNISGRFTLFPRALLWHRLRDVPDFRLKMFNRYHQLRETVLDADSLVAHYEEIFRNLERAGALDREYTRWSKDTDVAGLPLNFESEFSYLTDWLRRRVAYMDTHTFARLLGDVNADGEVNISDVTRLIDYLLTDKISLIDVVNSDADCNNEYNIADVTSIISIILRQ